MKWVSYVLLSTRCSSIWRINKSCSSAVISSLSQLSIVFLEYLRPCHSWVWTYGYKDRQEATTMDMDSSSSVYNGSAPALCTMRMK